MPSAGEAPGIVQQRLPAAAFPSEAGKLRTLAPRAANGLRLPVRENVFVRLRGKEGRRVGDGLVGVIDVVDEELATRTLAVVEGKALGFWVSSEDGELALPTGWTGDCKSQGINVGLEHELPSKERAFAV